jgi:hypothetical protein
LYAGKQSASSEKDKFGEEGAGPQSSPRPKLRTVFFAYQNAMLKVEPRFKPHEIVGKGAYGIVW